MRHDETKTDRGGVSWKTARTYADVGNADLRCGIFEVTCEVADADHGSPKERGTTAFRCCSQLGSQQTWPTIPAALHR